MASEAHDDDNTTLHDLAGIPAAALQSEGGQRLEPVAPGDAPPGRPLLDVMGEKFDAWFDGFNDDHANAPARAHEGTVSWKQADAAIGRACRDHNIDVSTRSVVARCRSTGRHMHGQPVGLPDDWMDSAHFVLDEERFRARRATDPDIPTSSFAVEVDGHDLGAVLQVEIDQVPGAPAQSVPTPTPQSSVVRHEKVDLAPTVPMGTELVPPRTSREDQLLPLRYRLLRTPNGIVAAWYGRPRMTDAEAVADAWRRGKDTE